MPQRAVHPTVGDNMLGLKRIGQLMLLGGGLLLGTVLHYSDLALLPGSPAGRLYWGLLGFLLVGFGLVIWWPGAAHSNKLVAGACRLIVRASLVVISIYFYSWITYSGADGRLITRITAIGLVSFIGLFFVTFLPRRLSPHPERVFAQVIALVSAAAWVATVSWFRAHSYGWLMSFVAATPLIFVFSASAAVAGFLRDMSFDQFTLEFKQNGPLRAEFYWHSIVGSLVIGISASAPWPVAELLARMTDNALSPTLLSFPLLVTIAGLCMWLARLSEPVLGHAIVARLISDLDGSPAYAEALRRHSRYVADAQGAEEDGTLVVKLQLKATPFLGELSRFGPWLLQHPVYRIQFRREARKWEALNRYGLIS